MSLIVVEDNSTEAFLKEAGLLLHGREAEYSLMLGLCNSLINSNTEIYLYRILNEGTTTSAVVQTPPYNLILTIATEAELDLLCNYIFDKGIELPGVVGPAQETTYYARKWASMTGKRYELGMIQKIYACNEVISPRVTGQLKVATETDKTIVAKWLYEFSKESLPGKDKFEMSFAEEWSEKAIANKTAYLWTTESNTVAVAHTGRPTLNGISIRAVYTPPENRKNGYGSAVVAALTTKMLESNYKFCTLYTDLSNPTSNSIYQKIGYREVADSRHFIFS